MWLQRFAETDPIEKAAEKIVDAVEGGLDKAEDHADTLVEKAEEVLLDPNSTVDERKKALQSLEEASEKIWEVSDKVWDLQQEIQRLKDSAYQPMASEAAAESAEVPAVDSSSETEAVPVLVPAAAPETPKSDSALARFLKRIW
jgi:predicted translin family RNA/ssDNA-binding protein